MRRITALAFGSLLVYGPQFAMAASSNGDTGGDTKSKCVAEWVAMEKEGTTGGQSRKDYLRRCEGLPPGGGGVSGVTEGLVLLGAGAGGLLIAAAAQHNDHPASP